MFADVPPPRFAEDTRYKKTLDVQYYLGDLVDEGEDPLVVEINTTDDIFTYIWFYADTLVNCNFAWKPRDLKGKHTTALFTAMSTQVLCPM